LRRRTILVFVALCLVATVAAAEYFNYNASAVNGNNTGNIGGFMYIGSANYTDTGRFEDIITRGPWADVLAYGADATGVADSTAAIQAAIDSGNPVYLPPGTYRTTGTLTVNSHYTTIFGAGAEKSIIAPDNAGFVVITIANTDWVQYCNFLDFAIVAGGTSNLGAFVLGDGTGATDKYAAGLNFVRLRIRDFTGTNAYAFRLRSSYQNNMQDVHIYNCFYGYYVTTEAVANLVTSTYVRKGGVSLCRNAVFFDVRVTDFVLDSVVLQNNTHEAIKSTGANTAMVVRNCYFEGNNASGSGEVYFTGTSGANNSSKIIIDSCFWHTTTQPRIYLDYTWDSVIQNNIGLIAESPASIADTANSRAFFFNNQDWSSQSAVALYATLNGTNTWIETTPGTGYKTIGGPHEVDITGDIRTDRDFYITNPDTPANRDCRTHGMGQQLYLRLRR
jgi:hypothetical protein